MKNTNHLFILIIPGLFLMASCNLDKIEETPASCVNVVKAAFETDKTTGVIPCEVNFTNKTTGATSFSWTFSNTQTSNAQNPGKITFTSAGNFTVTLIASNADGCADTAEVTIMVVDPQQPTVACFTNAGQTNSGAAPSTVSFNADCTQNASSFSWTFGDSGSATNTATGISATHLFETPGNYPVKLTATGPGGSDDTTIMVVIKETLPQASFAVENDGCGAICDVKFNNTSTNATSYQWDFNDGGNSVLASPEHTFQNKGIYNVRLIATGAGGADTAYHNVTILKLPAANFNITDDNCIGPCTITFTETCQFETSYKWDFGVPGATSTLANPTFDYPSKGTYQVRLIAINTDGADTITKTVTIKSANFKAVVEVNGADITPLYGVQRSDGQLHVLFTQNSGYKSVLISPSQTVGNVAAYVINDLGVLDAIIPSGDGGFALTGDNTGSNKAVLAKISATQTTGFTTNITFNGSAQLSQGGGVALNSANQYVVTGDYIPTGGGDQFPGFALVSQSGSVSGNTFVNAPVATTGSLSGAGITQLSNGQYMLLAPQLTFGGNPKKYLVKTGSAGAYVSNSNLGTGINMKQIISSGTSSFVWQVSNSVVSVVKYSSSFNNQGAVMPGSVGVSQILIAADGNLIVCGNKSGSAWMAKYNSSTMSSTPIWEKTYTESNGTTQSVSVATLSNGGYLLTGLFTSSTGDLRLYLVKTDNEGNTD